MSDKIPSEIEEKARQYVINKHGNCVEGKSMPLYTEDELHFDNVKSFLAGHSLASKTIDEKDEEISKLYSKLEYAMKGYPEHEKVLMQTQIDLLVKINEHQASTIAEQQKRIEELEKRDGVVLLTQSSSNKM